MKILIPFSGGINSTYGLWRFLSETDHEIIAYFADESWLKTKFKDDPEISTRVSTAADNIAAYLKENIRDFDYQKDAWSNEAPEEIVPMRIGGTNTWDISPLLTRWKGYKSLIEEIKPDGFVFGFSLENTFHDYSGMLDSVVQNAGVDFYLTGCKDLFTPVEVFDASDHNTFLKTMVPIGRFSQREALPDAIVDMVAPLCVPAHKSEDLGSGGIACRMCLYQEVIDKRTDLDGSTLDNIFAEKGCYGKWRDLADLPTYQYRGDSILVALELLGINPETGVKEDD